MSGWIGSNRHYGELNPLLCISGSMHKADKKNKIKIPDCASVK